MANKQQQQQQLKHEPTKVHSLWTDYLVMLINWKYIGLTGWLIIKTGSCKGSLVGPSFK